MNAPAAAIRSNRFLSHVEIVHRPGERHLARDFLGLLGIELEDAMGGRFMLAVIDRDTYEPLDFSNFFGGSEVNPEQWALEQALIAEFAGTGPLAERFADYQLRLDRDPTSGMHIGIHFTSVEAWEAAVTQLARFEEERPALAGRVRVCSVTRPGDPGSFPPLYQAFVWTDVVSAGSLAMGQRFELSALDPADHSA